MKGKVKHIVNKIMKHIKKLDNNTRIATFELYRNVGYEDDDFGNMMDIDYALSKYCHKAGILLDCSEFDMKCVGLPYNIPFVIRKIGKKTF